mgnify:CR=1 FL=1
MAIAKISSVVFQIIFVSCLVAWLLQSVAGGSRNPCLLSVWTICASSSFPCMWYLGFVLLFSRRHPVEDIELDFYYHACSYTNFAPSFSFSDTTLFSKLREQIDAGKRSGNHLLWAKVAVSKYSCFWIGDRWRYHMVDTTIILIWAAPFYFVSPIDYKLVKSVEVEASWPYLLSNSSSLHSTYFQY